MNKKTQIPPQAILILIVVLALIACVDSFQWGEKWITLNSNLPATTTAKEIIPNINGYEQADANNLMAKATSTIVVTSVVYTTKDIKMAYNSAQLTEKFVNCYQQAGAIDSKGFYNKSDPIYGGVIVVVDRNQIKDPKLLSNCIKKVPPPFSIIGVKYTPCSDKIIVKTNYNSFYVLTAGTDITVCSTFRNSLLQKIS